MASPVDTTVKHFFRAMSGAPVLNGQAGSMIAVLDACLVTGFDLKAATALTVAGGVATLTFSGTHSASLHAVILVEGVTGPLAGLNGEQKVTHTAAGQLRFATALADGTAAGTVTFKMAPAGWTKVFSGTNKAVYQSADPTSTKMYVRVDDSFAETHCRLRGFEVMTDIDSGAGLFPTDAQISGGGYMAKAWSSDTTPVPWVLVADARGAYINITPYGASNPSAAAGRTCYLGDMSPLRPGGDPYAFSLGVSAGPGHTQATGTCDTGESNGQYFPRSHVGLGVSLNHSVRSDVGSATSGMDDTRGVFPSPVDGSLLLSRRFAWEGMYPVPRAYFPGLYTVPQSDVGLYIAPGTVQAGGAPLGGRQLLALGCGASNNTFPSGNIGISFIDITGPWVR